MKSIKDLLKKNINKETPSIKTKSNFDLNLENINKSRNNKFQFNHDFNRINLKNKSSFGINQEHLNNTVNNNNFDEKDNASLKNTVRPRFSAIYLLQKRINADGKIEIITRKDISELAAKHPIIIDFLNNAIGNLTSYPREDTIALSVERYACFKNRVLKTIYFKPWFKFIKILPQEKMHAKVADNDIKTPENQEKISAFYDKHLNNVFKLYPEAPFELKNNKNLKEIINTQKDPSEVD